MQRIASVSLPRWSVDLVRRRLARSARSAGAAPPRDAPLLLVSTSAGRELVERCCERASGRGVKRGMTLAHARALVSGPASERERDEPSDHRVEPSDHRVEPFRCRVEPFRPDRDGAALEALAQWALRFSPVVAVDAPDGLLLDLAGGERLFGGEAALVRAIRDGVEALGVRARVASAATVGCAWAVARWGEEPARVVAPGDERATLEPLPPRALRLADGAVDALEELGVVTVGQLLELPRDELPARFGEELLLRVDQALGRTPELLARVEPRERIEVARAFDGPVKSLEAVMRAARELVVELTEVLAARGLGAREVELVVAPSDLPPRVCAVALSRPSRDARHLGALLEPKLERTSLGFGVERLALRARDAVPLRGRQLAVWSGSVTGAQRLDRAMGELVDALAGRIGTERILRAEAIESHLPERAFRLVPVGSAAPAEGAAGEPRATPFDRPSRLFEPPEPLEVRADAAGRPVRLAWRGARLAVAGCAGPERVDRPWWTDARRDGFPRDYFRVTSTGGRSLWIFREHAGEGSCEPSHEPPHEPAQGRWFAHGEWV